MPPKKPTAVPAAARERQRTERALTTIEVAERLSVHAYAAIEAGDPEEAKRLLAALTGHTTATTASMVKSQSLSDSISNRARTVVAEVDAFRSVAAAS